MYKKPSNVKDLTDREIQEYQLEAMERVRKNTALIADIMVYSIILSLLAAVIVMAQ